MLSFISVFSGEKPLVGHGISLAQTCCNCTTAECVLAGQSGVPLGEEDKMNVCESIDGLELADIDVQPFSD